MLFRVRACVRACVRVCVRVHVCAARVSQDTPKSCMRVWGVLVCLCIRGVCGGTGRGTGVLVATNNNGSV